MYKYPSTDLDRSELLLNLLGSFWAGSYQGREFVSDLVNSKARLTAQTYQNLLELISAVSRFDIPVFHKEYWASLPIRESTLVRRPVPRFQYDGDPLVSWGGQTSNLFNATKFSDEFVVPKPLNLVRVPVLTNKMLQPSVVFTSGIDYQITASQIEFLTNPFDNAQIPKLDILNDRGELVDREITLWVYSGDWDLGYIYEQFGYAVGVYARSSENYKQLINAILDATTQGTSARAQQLILSAATGVPLVIEAEETIEYIYSTIHKLQILTNKNVYNFSAQSAPVVNVGDRVFAGDSLVDDFQVYELNRGPESALQALQRLTLDTELLSFHYFGGLTFENEEVPIAAAYAPDGKLDVSWQLVGFPPDVELFWQEVAERGRLEGVTLAELLDTRVAPTTPPTPADLPATVNPLHFLLSNVLRNNATIVKLKYRAGGTAAMASLAWEHFRRVQPPHTCLLIVQEFEVEDVGLNPVSVVGPLGAWYSETVTDFTPVAAVDDLDAGDYLAEAVQVFYTTEGCGGVIGAPQWLLAEGYWNDYGIWVDTSVLEDE